MLPWKLGTSIRAASVKIHDSLANMKSSSVASREIDFIGHIPVYTPALVLSFYNPKIPYISERPGSQL